jgi:hypothetical protein
MVRLVNQATLICACLVILGCGQPDDPVAPVSTDEPVALVSPDEPAVPVTFDLSLDLTRTSGPVVVKLKRLALLERSEANLGKEPLPREGKQSGEGHYLACELEILVEGKPMGGEGASSVKSVGPLVVSRVGKPLERPSSSFSLVDDDPSRPGWRYLYETVEPVYGPGSFAVSYAVKLVGGETHEVSFEGLNPK